MDEQIKLLQELLDELRDLKADMVETQENLKEIIDSL